MDQPGKVANPARGQLNTGVYMALFVGENAACPILSERCSGRFSPTKCDFSIFPSVNLSALRPLSMASPPPLLLKCESISQGR